MHYDQNTSSFKVGTGKLTEELMTQRHAWYKWIVSGKEMLLHHNESRLVMLTDTSHK